MSWDRHEDYDAREAYDPSDPKHPDWEDAMADEADRLRKIEKEEGAPSRGPLIKGTRVEGERGRGTIVGSRRDTFWRSRVYLIVELDANGQRYAAAPETLRMLDDDA